jgi:hypothetical protein
MHPRADDSTSLDRYKGRCYDIELVSGEDNQYIAAGQLATRPSSGGRPRPTSRPLSLGMCLDSKRSNV